MQSIQRLSHSIQTAGSKPVTFDLHYMEGQKAQPVLIFIHGFKGFKDWGHWLLMADAWAAAGIAAVRMNLSYNGTTPEHPTDFADTDAFGRETFSRDVEDVSQLVAFLKASGWANKEGIIDPDRLALAGHSRGGAVAVLAAAALREAVKAVITMASIDNTGFLWTEERRRQILDQGVTHILNARTGQQLPVYREVYDDWLAKKDTDYNLENKAKSLDIPALVIHGTADEAVPLSAAQNLAAWIPNATLHIVEGAGHTFGGMHPYESNELPGHAQEVIHVSVDFLKKHL
ncbi:alpha/beta hydrolase family protein [Thermonema rossianum]|jgi:pimeloyl-ACP methyl ester carboxylesterase|uniref:alpha/beta hydrolase family protein n=1 Tax=Thermonema rossianum TaxID=55505 RepID=UPI00056FB400|nr:alpha/beta fold hydrolase [Thermonema rossianum]